MSSTSASTPAHTGSTPAPKQSKVVVLHLSSDKLSEFPAIAPPPKTLKLKGPKAKVESDSTAERTQIDNASESNATPTPNDAMEANGRKRKSIGEHKAAGVKKPALDENGMPKPRGKPGPKRRKLDGENGVVKGAGPGASAAAHKLGPKANQGAINAGLRALDRSGTPSRKWHRTGFMLKSFTGVSWAIRCWETPKLSNSEGLSGDVKSETPSSSDANKQEPASSAIGSDSGGGALASSPPRNVMAGNSTPA